MKRPTAKQIVDSLLEYGGAGGGWAGGEDPQRPGNPEDPWRKAMGMKLPFQDMDFNGKRPTVPVEFPTEEQPGGTLPPTEVPLKHKKPLPPRSRFTWTPPPELPPPPPGQ